ncbi:MAG TPA: class I lanthipeptide [Thermoanaerobaculia bacterium]|nr:class I lanthipeptide [Thermoanaerobaculia bacterium]
MKRKIQTKPLQLSRETLRQLDNDRLSGVGGGIFTDTITTIFSEVVSCPQ